MRESADNDFSLEVDGIGAFVFGRRKVRDRFRVSAEVNRLTEGELDDDSAFVLVAEAYATLRVMMVEGPVGFRKLLDLDADADDAADEPVMKVYFEYRKKEAELRKAATKSGEVESTEAAGDDRLVVQESLPTSAD